MPNHVKSIITITGKADEVKKFMEEVKNYHDVPTENTDGYDNNAEENLEFDFNKFIPMPESLNINCSSEVPFAISAYLMYSEENKIFCGPNVKKKLKNEPQEVLDALSKALSGYFRKIPSDMTSIIVECTGFAKKAILTSEQEIKKNSRTWKKELRECSSIRIRKLV